MASYADLARDRDRSPASRRETGGEGQGHATLAGPQAGALTDTAQMLNTGSTVQALANAATMLNATVRGHAGPPTVQRAAAGGAVVQRQLNGDQAEAVHDHYVEHYAPQLSWARWRPYEEVIVRDHDDVEAARAAVDAQARALIGEPGEGQDALVEHAQALIAGHRTAEVRELLLEIQRRRADDASATGTAGEREAELRCLLYLKAEDQPAEAASQAAPAPDLRGFTGQIATVPAAFDEAMALVAEEGQRIWGSSEEELILGALTQATSGLLLFNRTQNDTDRGILYPGPDQLNNVGDLAEQHAAIVHMLLQRLAPDEDDYGHVYERVKDDGPERNVAEQRSYVDQHGRGAEELTERLRIRAEKAANSWLKVATPYVELKVAFLDGWEAHEHGALAHRGFYYLMTHDPARVGGEIAGNRDVQAAITEPVSGKVALATALREVFDSAACHEDALQFLRLLGTRTYARGRLSEREGGSALLPALQASLLRQLNGRDAPIVGLRLRDDNHHSLVLLFEHVPDIGLAGAQFDTVAGRNTDRILYFMESLSPLRMARQLIASGLPRALQMTRPGWSLEWEAFDLRDPQSLGDRLRERSLATIHGVREGLDEHERAARDFDRLMSDDDDDDEEAPWSAGAKAHVAGLRDEKPRYLAEKDERRRREQEANERTAEERGVLRLRYEGELRAVRNDHGRLQALLREIVEALGADQMFQIAGGMNLSFDLLEQLLPELY